MNNLIKFENNSINIINNDGEVLFEVYSVGQAIGHIVTAKGKEYANKARIDKVLENAEIEPVLHGAKPYLTEEMLYDFIFESRTEKSKAFRKWVTNEVLPTIRATGAYVPENITDKQEEALRAFSTPRFRKDIFLNTPVEKLQETYQECLKYHKRKPSKDKIKIQKEIIKTLEERKDIAITNGSAPLALLIAEEIKSIQKSITVSSNRSNGRKLSIKNKEIEQLQSQLYELEPEESEWITVDFHGFSVNCCTRAVGDKTVATSAYNTWKNNFPVNQLPQNTFDFSNPIYIWLEFDHKSKLDVTNLHKCFIDKLCDYYGVDDQFVQLMRCTTRNYVDKYSEGKIHFAIREGIWQ